MRKYEVRVTPAAIADIEELADFYLELVDAESAARSIRPASRANTPSG
jgi:plasmid stabilization system protein ParE